MRKLHSKSCLRVDTSIE
uniref:Uncharacterized protein n=1 Tax=Anguilla anguilla TaxID=7936 RepID=A0A0E9RJC7_ANGAN